MRGRRLVVSLAVVWSVMAGVAEGQQASRRQVFIFAGQSNMSGYGLMIQLAPVPGWAQLPVHGWEGQPTRSSDTGIEYPRPTIDNFPALYVQNTAGGTEYVYDGWGRYVGETPDNASLSLGEVNNYGPELSFLWQYRYDNPIVPVAAIKIAIGGSSIEEWTQNSQNNYWDALALMIAQAAARLDAAEGSGSWEWAGLVWMQGENGASTVYPYLFPTPGEEYSDQLRAFLASVRAITRPDLPVVIGRIGNHLLLDNIIDADVDADSRYTAEQYRAATNYRRAQQELVAGEPYNVLADTDDLPVLQDGDPAYWYHHTGAGYLAMGERFYLSFKSLVQPGSVPLDIAGPASLPPGGIGVPYPPTRLYAIGGSGGYTWSALGLPAGLAIDPVTGVIAGTPAGAIGSPFTVAVTVTDEASGIARREYSLTISPLAVAVLSPNGGEKLFPQSPYVIEWAAMHESGEPVAFDVAVSTNGGSTYSNIAACSGLPGSARSCLWPAPGPASSSVRIRVTGRDAAGVSASDASNADFTIASGAPSITVTSPNTLVSWTEGTAKNITWNHNLGATSRVRLDISRDGGATWAVLAPSVPNSSGTKGTFTWIVDGPPTATALIRVVWIDGAAGDASNTPFTIAAPAIRVTAPNSPVSWRLATKNTIAFTHNLGTGRAVAIEVSRDGGSSWTPLTTLTTSSATTGSYSWTVTGPITTEARIRVSASGIPAAADMSDVDFTIRPTVTVTAPNTTVSWRVGEARTITFTHNMGVGHVANIDVSGDGGATWAPLGSLTTTAATSGSYPWTVAGPVTSLARVRVTWAGDPAATDMSNRNFTILPRVTVTAPNTAVTWTAGSLRTVTWAHNLGVGARVDIDFSPDAGATWIALARGVPSTMATTGSASVTMPAMATAQALIKVTQSDDPSQSDVSNVPFTLTP